MNQPSRFQRAVHRMAAEPEEELAPLPQPLEDRLVQGVLSEVRAQRLRRSLRYATAGVSLAAAFALFLVFRPDPDHLPRYHAEFGGSDQVLASPKPGNGGPHPVRLDAVFPVTLRPEQRVRGTSAVQVFVRQGGEVHAWDVELSGRPSGVYLLKGSLKNVDGLRPGPAELIFAISPASRRPRPEELRTLLSQADAPATSDLQIEKLQLELLLP